MGLMYSAVLDAISVTNDSTQDIWEMVVPATLRVVIHEMRLTSAYATDERTNLRLVRRSTTGSAGGSAITPKALDEGNTKASALTSFTPLVTTPGTIGAILEAWQWSQQGELLYLPTPECRTVVAYSGRLCLNISTALGGTRVWSGSVKWEEL